MDTTYDAIVIGSGPGGYVAAIRLAQLGFKTACVEKEKNLGGTCLNVGCIPSKALLQSSESYHSILHTAQKQGIEIDNVHLNFKQMMERKNGVVSGFNAGIASLFKKNKITWITGHATFKTDNTIVVQEKEYTAKYFVIATGSEPTPLPFLPFDEKTVLSSTGALSLNKVPQKMVLIGAGIIGVELGSVYARLGTQVQVVEFLDRICPTLDLSLGKTLQKCLEKQGLEFHLSSKVKEADLQKESVTLTVESPKETFTLSADTVLVAVGRRPYAQGLGLETIGLETDKGGRLVVDGLFRTSKKHIYAIGDVIDGPMLAHKASEEGIAVAEIMAQKRPHLNYVAIPSVVYTHPEVASVGLTEEEGKKLGLTLQVGQFPFKANSRARCSGEEEGFIKIVVETASRIIVGVHIIGAHAGELIAEATLAVEKRLTVDTLAATSHAHPTLAEALKEAALAVDKRAIHI